jgi:CRISPR/Cas system-associated exonuclease Cas4 (RecB family)
MTKAHYTEIAPTLQPLAEPELEFTVPIPGVRRKLYGFIDLVAAPIRAGKVIAQRMIRDTKTTSRAYVKSAADFSHQLTAYAHAHKVLYKSLPHGVGLDVVVNDPKSAKVSVQQINSARTDSEITRFVTSAQMIEKAVDAGIFPPVDDSKTCSWCGYRDMCNTAAARRARAFAWK